MASAGRQSKVDQPGGWVNGAKKGGNVASAYMPIALLLPICALFKLATELWQLRADGARGGKSVRGLLLAVQRAWLQIPPFAHSLFTKFVSVIWKLSVSD